MILNFPIRLGKAKKVFGYTGSVLWLLIIPIKLDRFFNIKIFDVLSNNLPSFLGTAGLFLILLSAKGKLSNLTVVQCAMIAAAVSIIVEVIQLIPRPGILAYIRYTFDYHDILFVIAGVVISYLIIVLLHLKNILKK